MSREPLDFAIDALVNARSSLLGAVARIDQALKTLQADPAADRRKFQCSRCGLRFAREDLLADHTANVHDDTAPSSPDAVRALVEQVGLDGPPTHQTPSLLAALDISDQHDWAETMKQINEEMQ